MRVVSCFIWGKMRTATQETALQIALRNCSNEAGGKVSIYEILLKGESESEVTQSRPALCDPMDCSPPGSSVHGILQARILEWVAISFSKALIYMRSTLIV